MWRTTIGWICGVVGLAVVASSAVAPAFADTSEVRVQVAEYVLVADGADASTPSVDSNVAVDVVVGEAGYVVSPR